MCRRTVGCSPVALTGIWIFLCLLLWNTELYQVAKLRFDALPLFPYQRPEPSSEPFICLCQQAFHICQPKIIQPACNILAQCLFSSFIAPTVAPRCQFPDFCPHLCYTLWITLSTTVGMPNCHFFPFVTVTLCPSCQPLRFLFSALLVCKHCSGCRVRVCTQIALVRYSLCCDS